MKKNAKIIINCTSQLKEKLQQRAKKCNLTLTGYCLLVLSQAEPRIVSVQ